METPRHTRPALRRGIGAALALSAAAGLGMAALAGAAAEADEAAQAITVTAARDATTVTGGEALRAGLTRVTFRNTTNRDGYVQVMRLRPGVTVAQVRARLRRSRTVPNRLVSLPTSAFIGPRETRVHTVALPRGEYVVTQPPDGAGLGPATTFTVGAGSAGGTPPRAADTITMYDHGFRVSSPIEGRGTVAIRNIGAHDHFIVGIRLNRPADAPAVARILSSGEDFEGPPPGRFVSIMGLVGPGTTNYVRMDLPPGRYVIACFNSDRRSGGREHSRFGMVRIITVR